MKAWPHQASRHNPIQMNLFFHFVTRPINCTACSSCTQESPLSWEAYIKILRLQIKIKESLSRAQQKRQTDGPLTRIHRRTAAMISDSCQGHEPRPGFFDWLWSWIASLMTCFLRQDGRVCALLSHNSRGFSCGQVSLHTTDFLWEFHPVWLLPPGDAWQVCTYLLTYCSKWAIRPIFSEVFCQDCLSCLSS